MFDELKSSHLAAKRCHKVLQILFCNCSILNAAETLSRIPPFYCKSPYIYFKVVFYSACNFTNSDYINYIVQENEMCKVSDRGDEEVEIF